MNGNGGLIVAVLGIGVAGFLYFRSQQQQAAALADAAAAPGPGLLQKAENSAKEVGRVAVPALTAPVRSIAGGVSSLLGGGHSSGPTVAFSSVIARLRSGGRVSGGMVK